METAGLVLGALVLGLILIELVLDRHVLSIALRNVRRGSRRTVMAVVAIAVSTVGLTFFGGFITDTFHRLREGTIGSGIGHVQVFRAGYERDAGRHPAEFSLQEADYLRIQQLVRADPWLSSRTQGISPELEFFGIAVTGDSQGDFMCRAVLPDRDRLTNIPRLTLGRDLEQPDESNVLVGTLLAKKLNVELAKPIKMMVYDRIKGYRAVEVAVKGEFTTGFADWDRVILKLPLETAWRMFESKRVTRVVIRLKDTSDTSVFDQRIRSLAKNAGLQIETKTWVDLAEYYHQVNRMLSGVYRFVLIVIILIVLVLVANVVTMTVLERTTEIGTLRAMGTRRSEVTLLFLNEGVLLGILGGIAGVLFAVCIASLINIRGIPQPPPPGSTVPVLAHIRFYEDPRVLLTAFCGPLIAATLASVWPSIRAARMSIAECLRRVA